MKFGVSARILYQAVAPSTLILNIQPFATVGQRIAEEHMHAVPELKMQELNAVSGEKRFKVISIPEAGPVSITYQATVENKIRVIPAARLADVPISAMPAEALYYLNPSRYCQSDRLYRFAYNKFGNIPHAYDKVMAIREWIYENVAYGGYTTPQTSAYDTITEQIGVCRDFAHLGVALCRALTIPARYFTCYAYQLNPADFHACFEVYLGGHWVIIDATKLAPVNGLVKIASGADATDTAFAGIFGDLRFRELEVSAVLLDQEKGAAEEPDPSSGYSYF